MQSELPGCVMQAQVLPHPTPPFECDKGVEGSGGVTQNPLTPHSLVAAGPGEKNPSSGPQGPFLCGGERRRVQVIFFFNPITLKGEETWIRKITFGSSCCGSAG